VWERAIFEDIRLRALKVAGQLEVLRAGVKLHLASALEEPVGGSVARSRIGGNTGRLARDPEAAPPALENRGVVELICVPAARKTVRAPPRSSVPVPKSPPTRKIVRGTRISDAFMNKSG